MTKKVMYTYLGTNGTICSPVHLEGIYYVRNYKIQADKNKMLTKDGKNYVFSTIIPEEDLNQWFEVNEDELDK